MEADFLSVLIKGSPHRVYGYRLRPYSLIHSFYLEALESPFVSGGHSIPSASETAMAAAICSQEWPNVAETQIHSWRAIVYRNPEREATKLFKYMQANKSFPEPIASGNPLELGTPWQLRMVTSLLTLGICKTWREAWTFSLDAASWALAANNENVSKRCCIWTDQARKEEEELEAMKEQPMPEWVKEMSEKIKKGAVPD